ncbi:MAG: lysophospholipid acyltransferase family protein [Pseudomonadota bacterium]
MTALRSKLFDLLFGLWTIVLGVLAWPVMLAVGTPARVRALSRIWTGGIIMGLRFICGLSHREKGLENKFADGPVIYACNHQSSWETLVITDIIPDLAVVLKKSLYSYPIMGWYLKHSPMIAVDRQAGSKAMKQILAGARSVLEEGRSILIFPEGTRQDLDSDEPYNRGVALLYRQLNLPVVPVAMNSGLFWSKNGFNKRAGEITVSYLPAIPPGLGTDEFMKRLETSIRAEQAELCASEA